MFGYRVPDPDEALLISGGQSSSGAPFRVVVGHGAFVLPLFRRANLLSLAMTESEVQETCVTRQGIALNVKAVIAFKVGSDIESIVAAGQRFLSDQDQMSILTGRIFAGHLRSIIGSMTVEEIVTERQKLASEVLDGSKEEMAKIGLTVDALQIQSIDDGRLGYILAMSAPHNAAIQQAAAIAQSNANQMAAQAEQDSLRKQAEYQRQTTIVQAQYKAEVDRAQAAAAQSGPLSQAQAQLEVLHAQKDVAERNAELREQQLIAEVVKPALAEAEKTKILAGAEAEKIQILAAAAASNNRVALDRMLIEQLPEIVKSAAQGLSGANVTVLNGADGLGDIAASLVGQGSAIFEAVRKSFQGGAPGAASPGQPHPRPVNIAPELNS
ncbi:MAG: SPFH domain-containing protein [Actinomycetota bacterium]|jgi:flotillin|nr:SPFH domain-containing protein [Actinomycetota bacterium]